MSPLPFGTIVLTAFPFTDLSAAKRRPALVISDDNDRRADVVVAYITSVARDDPDSAPIKASSTTGLKVPSLVRFDKIATLSKNVLIGRLGTAAPNWLAANRRRFCAVFGFATAEPTSVH